MHNSQGPGKGARIFARKFSAGDEKRLKEQRDAGKLTARERIAKIADAGSFVELFALVSRNEEGAGVVTGYATIEERPVYLFAQDFTVRGGAMGKAAGSKDPQAPGHWPSRPARPCWRCWTAPACASTKALSRHERV